MTRRRRMDREEKLKYINRKKIDIKICKKTLKPQNIREVVETWETK